MPIIEDDYGADLSLDETPPPPALRSLDGDVIYIGTFSKKLVPALRIGFVVCPRALRPALLAIKQRSTRHVAPAAARPRRVPRARLPARAPRAARCPSTARAATRSSRRSRAPAAGHEVAPPERGSCSGCRCRRVSIRAVFDEAQRRGVLVGPSALYEVERGPSEGSASRSAPSRRALASARKRLGEALAPSPAAAAPARSRRRAQSRLTEETIMEKATFATKVGLAEMLKGGVIMDVVNAEQAQDRRGSGRRRGDGARARARADPAKKAASRAPAIPAMIQAIQRAVSIPVMAKCRIGHFMEARILEALEVDFIDESEVLTPADEELHIDKRAFEVPFVCGCRDLGEALRRIGEGAAMIRTKGEAGTGDIVEAVRHLRARARADPQARRRSAPRSW